LAEAKRPQAAAGAQGTPSLTLKGCARVELANSSTVQCGDDTPEDRARQAAEDTRIGAENAEAAADRARREAQSRQKLEAAKRQAEALRAAREAARARCQIPGAVENTCV